MTRYDEDFFRWATEQAEALRGGRIAELDIENKAEEIESMANRDLRELHRRLWRILEHNLKLLLLAGPIRQQHERGCELSIESQQAEIEFLLQQSPSLRGRIAELLPSAYRRAVKSVATGYGLVAPPECPWSAEELL